MTTPTPAEVKDYGPSFDSPVSPVSHPQVSRGVSRSYGGYNTQSKPHNYQHHHPVHTQEVHDWADAEVDEADSAEDVGPVGNLDNRGFTEPGGPIHANGRPFYERQCARSIMLNNLADGTTHADITQAIRGGQLLDIYLRPHDRTAAVSFLLAADARAFFDHVRRYDLYIRQKRVRI